MAFRDTADFVKDILRELSEQNISYIVDASLHHEPETTDIDRTAKLARDNGCGAVLAIGGGSVMDAAKAVAMLVTNPGTVVDYQMKGKVVENPTVPLIAVPTTSGTGSEATKVSVVYNPDNGLIQDSFKCFLLSRVVQNEDVEL
jgi:alcohol dehydrogenase class IV